MISLGVDEWLQIEEDILQLNIVCRPRIVDDILQFLVESDSKKISVISGCK